MPYLPTKFTSLNLYNINDISIFCGLSCPKAFPFYFHTFLVEPLLTNRTTFHKLAFIFFEITFTKVPTTYTKHIHIYYVRFERFVIFGNGSNLFSVKHSFRWVCLTSILYVLVSDFISKTQSVVNAIARTPQSTLLDWCCTAIFIIRRVAEERYAFDIWLYLLPSSISVQSCLMNYKYKLYLVKKEFLETVAKLVSWQSSTFKTRHITLFF